MVSPTRNEILAQIVAYVKAATGLADGAIIRGKQNAPSPTNSYASVLYISDTGDGTANADVTEIDGSDTQLNYSLRAKRYYSYSVQFYRDGAADLARSLMLFHETPEGQEFQQTAFFTIRRIVDISESAVLMSNNYEERAALTVELNVNETLTNVVNRTNSIVVNTNFDDGRTINEQNEVIANG
jgi:hypothetical protein